VVSVRTPAAERLLAALAPVGGVNGARVERTGPQTLRVSGMPAARVGELAFAAGVRLHELSPERGGLEEIFFALTTTATQTESATGQEGR
jgi:ABC-2 type transport system ATP-binding protein